MRQAYSTRTASTDTRDAGLPTYTRRMPTAIMLAILVAGTAPGVHGSNQAPRVREHPLVLAGPHPEEPAPKVRFTLAASTHPARPGESVTIGLCFDIDDQWHMYWNGRNDSGLPPTVAWRLPDGWSVTRTQWPAPVRYTSDILLDHVYFDRVVLLATISIPDTDTTPGSRIIRADARWMVCQEACILERGSAEATISLVGPGDRPPPQGHPVPAIHPLIHSAEKDMPRPRARAKDDGHAITELTEPEGATVRPLRLGFRVEKARKLEFYPDRDCADLNDLHGEGSADSDTLILTLSERPPAEAGGTDRLPPRLIGVLAVWPIGDAPPVYYQVDAG